MFKVHTDDGKTLCLDLADEEAAREWAKLMQSPAFNSRITGLTVNHNGIQVSLPRPRGFSDYLLGAEYVAPTTSRKHKGGIRLVCAADDIESTIMIHSGQSAVRVGLSKIWRQVYNPQLKV